MIYGQPIDVSTPPAPLSTPDVGENPQTDVILPPPAPVSTPDVGENQQTDEIIS